MKQLMPSGIRYLDPIRNKGTKKDFYSSNIVNELDKHYGISKK